MDHPIIECLQGHQVVARIRGAQRVEIDFADRAEIGADLRHKAVGQFGSRQPFRHLLPVPVVLRLVIENQDLGRQPEHREGAQMFQVRDSVDRDFDRDRYLLFYFFGGASRPLRDNLDVVAGHVGIRLHRQVAK